MIVGLLDRLIAGKIAPEIQLDLLEAAGRRAEAEVVAKLRAYQDAKPKDDPLAPYREALAGGNARRGRAIFADKSEIECLRCHKARARDGEIPGGEVGPDLTGIAARHDRAYILESIVNPNKQIAQGFESVVLATDDGRVITGVLRGEDDKAVHLMTAEGKPVDVPKDTIEQRSAAPPPCPPTSPPSSRSPSSATSSNSSPASGRPASPDRASRKTPLPVRKNRKKPPSRDDSGRSAGGRRIGIDYPDILFGAGSTPRNV